jgi:hypothetical protein
MYYKRIHWPNLPLDQVIKHVKIPNSRYMNHEGYVGPLDRPTVHKIYDLLGIDYSNCSCYSIMLGYFPANGGRGPIHSDKVVDPKPEQNFNQGIILPLINCDHLRWSWYNLSDPNAVYYRGRKESSVAMIPEDQAELLDSIYCHDMFIADIGTWHQLVNFGTSPAALLSIRLMPWGFDLIDGCNTLPPVANLSYINA